MTTRTLLLAASLAASLASRASAAPINFSFAGTFADDADVQLFTFTANGASTVRLISYSYGGGIQANGNVVTSGGFDPILAVFDNTGQLVGQNDDSISGTSGACGAAAVTPDPQTGNFWDTCMDLVLAAGDYTVSVMQYDNFAVGPDLSDGFQESSPTFTATNGCSNGQFCDADGSDRTNRWAFDVLNVEQASQVPEPASLALVALATASVVMKRRARND